MTPAETTPYLQVTSAEKRSGKTRLLEVLELLVADPLRTASITLAALFRVLEKGPRTLLIDEADTIFGRRTTEKNEDLRALLNAGYRRGAVVHRCEGSGRKLRVRAYPAFSPKALASIGTLPDTIADRCITIRLDRKPRGRNIRRFRYREALAEATPLREALGVLLSQPETVSGLRAACPDIPDALDDRAADGWEPLLVIADLAGGPWPEAARQAAVWLQAERQEADSERLLLLRHIREIFDVRAADFIPTGELLRDLVAREDGPWARMWGRTVSVGFIESAASSLAELLAPFRIRSRVRSSGLEAWSGDLIRGYMRADCEDAWGRYLEPGNRAV